VRDRCGRFWEDCRCSDSATNDRFPRLLNLTLLELKKVADAKSGLPREPHRVRVQLRGLLAEEVDLGVLPDDLRALRALVEARDAVEVVHRHPLKAASGRPAERELEGVEALVVALAGPAPLDPVAHVACERDALDDGERRLLATEKESHPRWLIEPVISSANLGSPASLTC
jgi:hypothetical protein